MINIVNSLNRNNFYMVLAGLFAFVIYSLNVRFMWYGIDFTDEGFYLSWISDPFSYEYGITNFGFFYFPFFSLFNENIVFLRWFNVFLIGGLGFFVTYQALDKFVKTIEVKEKVVLSFVLSSLCLALYSGTILFLPTPSYNDMNFAGLLVVMLGWLIGLEANRRNLILTSSFFIALGGLILFHGKPSTAVLVGFAIFLAMLIRSEKRVLWLSCTVVIFLVLLLASSFYISSGPLALIQRYITAYEIQSYLQSGHDFFSIIRLDDFSLGKRLWFYLFILFSLLVSFFYLDKNRKILFGRDLIIILLVGFVIYYILSGQVFSIGYYQGVFLLLLSMIPLVLFYMFGWLHGFKLTSNLYLFAFLSFVFIYAYAFGTNNNYFLMYHKVFFFFALVGAVLLREHIGLRSTLVFVIFLQSIVVLNLYKSYETPYRQPQPLSQNDALTNVHNSKLMLEKGFSKYIDELGILKTSLKATNLIDFSGQSPTLAYILDLKPVGVAWLLGGYPGSNEFAYQVLKQAGCSRFEDAILLYEPKGPISINIDVLSKFGLDLERDFELVYETVTPAGAGGYDTPRQQLFYYSKSENIKTYCNVH
ncbi:MAG: hypothetical protein GX801_03685 [Fibrobacter sp.]|nr:hypothetical protein [Fibrobacter sp.]